MSAETKRRFTLEEYLALERESETRYEFWNGEVFAMSGGTLAHELAMTNCHDELSTHLTGRCLVFSSNMQIKVPAAPPYRYADGSVICGQAEVERLNGNDLLLNPVLIFEVLSPSTEAYDRGDKFTYYKSIQSLREYLLIAQHRPHVTHYSRQSDGSWSYDEVNEISGSVYLPALEVTLALSNLYRGVQFESN